MDSLPLKLLPKLQKRFPAHEFLFQDPNEEWDMHEPFWVIDTVVGLKEPHLFDSLSAFITAPRLSMHDFDALSNLRFLQKLGKLPEIKIIGFPPGIRKSNALIAIEGFLKELQEQPEGKVVGKSRS
jgi:hypothetical protein